MSLRQAGLHARSRMLVCLVLVTTTFAPATASQAADATFVDVPAGHIFLDDVEWLAGAGITKGCNPPVNDQYCPNDYVTRGQMAAFLVRALHLSDDGGGDTFADDNNSLFENDIAKLSAAGITKGCNPPDNTKFCPNDRVTREQMAAFLHRALRDTTAPEVSVATVTDGQPIDTSTAGTGTGSFLLGGATSADTVSVTVSGEGGSAPATLDTESSPATWELDVSAAVSGPTTYTITAVDAAGNATVETITVNVRLPDPDEVILDPDVVIVDGALAGQLVSYEQTTGRIEFTGDIAEIVEPGSVLVAGPIGSIAPHGLMVTVESLSFDGATTTLVTSPAALLDVLRQVGPGLTSAPQIPVAFQSQTPQATRSTQSVFDGRWGLGLRGSLSYDHQFSNPAQSWWSLDVDAIASATAEVFIDIDRVAWWPPQYEIAKFNVESTGSIAGSTTLTMTASTQFSETHSLLAQDLAAGWLGPIPVTLEGEFIGEVAASATAEGSVTGTFDIGFVAGAERINGEMVPYSSFPRSGSFDVAATVDLEASVGLKLQLEVLLADTAGPHVVIGPELVATALIDLINRIIPWKVRVDLVADLGITGQVPVFGVELFEQSWELWRNELAVLAEGVIGLPGPAIAISKTLEDNDDIDQSGGVSAGDTLSYEIVLSNTGDETVTDVDVSDPLLPGLACTPTLPVATLVAGATVTCSGTYLVAKADVTSGSITNTTTGSALAGASGSLVETATVVTPTQPAVIAIDIDKSHANGDEDGSGGITENDTLTYTIAATNAGNVPLTGVAVDDPLVPTLACLPTGALYPGATITCTGDYLVTIDDVTAGLIENTASVSGYNVYWGFASAITTEIAPTQTPNPSLWAYKWLSSNSDEDASGDMTPGDTLNFGVSVVNNGTTVLTAVTVADALTPDFSCTPVLPIDLAIGASIDCTGTYVVTEQDYDDRFVTNTATATGLDPDLNVVEISDSATVERTKPYVEEVLAANPFAYWRMGGDTHDLMGSIDATAGNQPFTVASFVGATNDGAMDLGCCDTHGLFVPKVDEDTLTSSDFTFEMWIKPRYTDIGYPGISMEGGSWSLSYTGDTANGITTIRAEFDIDGNNYPIVDSMPLLTGANHVVLVKNGSTGKLYLDAEVIGSVVLPDSTQEHSPYLQWLPEAAQIDEMAWYQRALNSDEIALHHRIGTNPGMAPLSRSELITVFTNAGFDDAASKADSYNGPVFEWDTQVGDDFYRYTDYAPGTGNFLTGHLFDTPSEAVAALYLAIWGNDATLVQTVTANTANTTYIGYIANGSPHGYKQYVLLDQSEFTYSTGVPY